MYRKYNYIYNNYVRYVRSPESDKKMFHIKVGLYLTRKKYIQVVFLRYDATLAHE